MSDDLRRREPRRDLADLPPEDGIRSDHAGSSAGVTGPAPSGGDAGRAGRQDPEPGSADRTGADPAHDPARSGPLDGQFGSAGGGHGTGSADGASGGTPDGTDSRGGPGPQTDWLRTAPGEEDEGVHQTLTGNDGLEAGTRSVPSDALGE